MQEGTDTHPRRLPPTPPQRERAADGTAHVKPIAPSGRPRRPPRDTNPIPTWRQPCLKQEHSCAAKPGVMADIDVVAYLAGKGFHGKQANGPEVAYPCFFECGEDAHSRKKKLYVNTEDGFYVCFVCGAQGGTYLLQKHFGDNPEKPQLGEDPHVRRKILNWAADLGQEWLLGDDEALLHLLDERGLSMDTILIHKLGIVQKPWSLTGNVPQEFTRNELLTTGLVWKEGPRQGQDYFYSHLLIPYIHRNNVVGMRGRAWPDSGKGAKYLTGQGDVTRLFNLDSIDGADDVILTEGEYDAMVLQQHLRNSGDERAARFSVIGLSGVNGFPDGGETYFANAKRIYVGFDPDDAGKRAAKVMKERFGSRVRIIELPEDLPKADWTEYLLPIPEQATQEWHDKHPHAGHNWQDAMALVGNAAGKRIFGIREVGFSYRQMKAENPDGIKTGFFKLDDAIAPGLLPGQVMVVLAKTGTGKTIFLCNLAWNVREEKILFVSLEMTREEVYERLRRIALFYHPRWSDAQVESALHNIYIVDENRLAEKDIVDLVDEFVVETGERPRMMFIDYLGYFARGAVGNSQYEKATNAVMALKAIAKAGKLAIVSPAQVNRGAEEGKPLDLDDARDSGAVEETADFLLSLWRPDDGLSPIDNSGTKLPNGKLMMTVLKSRHGGKDRKLGLQMDALTLTIVDEESPFASRARDHTGRSMRGVKYEHLRAEETRALEASLHDDETRPLDSSLNRKRGRA